MGFIEVEWHATILRDVPKCKVKFLFIVISGICLEIFEGSHTSQRTAPEPMCLPTMAQAGRRREHTTKCIGLVHTDTLRIAQQRHGYLY